MYQFVSTLYREIRSLRLLLPLILLAGVMLVCLIFSLAPRQETMLPHQLRFTGNPMSAGWHAVEHIDVFGSAMHYRWTTGAAQLTLPNPGGPIALQLKLAGFGRTIPVTLTTPIHQINITVGSSPRIYHLWLGNEPYELITMQINSPSFIEAVDNRTLGVVVAEVTISGGGEPLRVVLISAILAVFAMYFILQRLFSLKAAASIAITVQTTLLAWQGGPGWSQGIFSAVQVVSVVGTALLVLTINLARNNGIVPRSIGHPSRWVIALRVVIATIFLTAAIWMEIVVVPDLDSDLGIYLHATTQALIGNNPYQPFLIGTSYVYPPPALAIFGPLTALTFSDAQLFWRILSTLAMLASTLALRRAFTMAIPITFGTTWLVVLMISFAPLWESVSIGQINTFVLLGLSLFVLGYRDRHWAWIGDVGLAAAIMFKISPLLLFALPLLRGDWQRCLRIGGSLLGLSLITLPWFGLRRWLEFATIVPLLFQGNNKNPYNLALAAIGTRINPSVSLLGQGLAITLIILWVVLSIWGRQYDPRPIFVFGILAMTLGSSLIWYHHLVFLIVPTAWLLFSTTGRWPALTAMIGMTLIQLNRPVEFGLNIGPWLAVLGYFFVLGATGVGMYQATQPDPV